MKQAGVELLTDFVPLYLPSAVQIIHPFLNRVGPLSVGFHRRRFFIRALVALLRKARVTLAFYGSTFNCLLARGGLLKFVSPIVLHPPRFGTMLDDQQGQYCLLPESPRRVFQCSNYTTYKSFCQIFWTALYIAIMKSTVCKQIKRFRLS